MLILFLSSLVLYKMFRSSFLRSRAVVSLVAILTLSQIETSPVRELGLENNYWSSEDIVSKKNSWWSKKSLPTAPDYRRGDQKWHFDEETDTAADSDTLPVYSTAYSCYTRECVPWFVLCAKRSSAPDEYTKCKKRHRLCGLLCGSVTPQEPLL